MIWKEDSMNSNLLVRLYRVGFGDCIYIQIPDDTDLFTILIDCGTSANAEEILKPVVQHLCSQLPKDESGKPRLDLLVVTHPHADHIKGFDPAWFRNVAIGRIWMTVFMDQKHPEAKNAQAFEEAAYITAKALLDRPGLQLSDGTKSLLDRSLSLSNTAVFTALRKDLAPLYPRLYVARDIARHLSRPVQTKHKLYLENGITCFRGFKEQNTCLRILAPEWDIDGTYLGQFTAASNVFQDPRLLDTEAYTPTPESESTSPAGAIANESQPQAEALPGNISLRDFRLLRSRMLYSALAFSQADDDLKNNVSVVLLLEWRGKRLLFTGDAEWNGIGVKPGQRNSSWDVMLNTPAVKNLLLQPFDLLKVAHHGSINGSPFEQHGLVKIMPKIAAPDRTHIVVSTEVGVHGKKYPVPYAPLMAELGQLAIDNRFYPTGEPELVGKAQPLRTDRESDSTVSGVDYLEVTL
jgi:beta-lactamase superfamily II metal-dependent hydrolase